MLTYLNYIIVHVLTIHAYIYILFFSEGRRPPKANNALETLVNTFNNVCVTI